MIREQLVSRGIRCSRVLDALRRVPRDQFVETKDRGRAFADQALPIQCDQTISQPYMVALMTEILQLSGDERVLEIGTGSGYQTAVLCELAGRVVTIERHERLSLSARERLIHMGYRNVHFVVGDGTDGCEEHAPYDRVLLTAAAARCPDCLLGQISEKGMFVGPIGTVDQQTLMRFTKLGDSIESKAIVECRFVPLVGTQHPR